MQRHPNCRKLCSQCHNYMNVSGHECRPRKKGHKRRRARQAHGSDDGKEEPQRKELVMKPDWMCMYSFSTVSTKPECVHHIRTEHQPNATAKQWMRNALATDAVGTPFTL